MKSTLALAVSIGLGVASTAALADGEYIGVSIGGCHYDVDFQGTEHGFDSEHSSCVGLLAGKRYSWGSVEGEYAQLGSYSIRNATNETDATISSLSFSLMPKLGPMFIKLGVERWMMSTTLDGTPTSANGFGAVYGLGAEFNYTKKATIRFGFDKHAGIDDQRVNVEKGVTRSYVALTWEL